MNYNLVFGMDQICVNEYNRNEVEDAIVRGKHWIHVHDIHGKPFHVNVDQIKFIEEAEEWQS